ncbi:hypothetical protein [Microbacterium gilvum]|uniref:Uncharacterized protein n=1 Tax=Microbacterium gilvum TaxID=1336204 RepID=A0ABP9A2Q9_9MICO
MTSAREQWGRLLEEIANVERASAEQPIVQAIDLTHEMPKLRLFDGRTIDVTPSASRDEIAHAISGSLVANADDAFAPVHYAVNLWWAELLYDLGGFADNLAGMVADAHVERVERAGKRAVIHGRGPAGTAALEVRLDTRHPPTDLATDLAPLFAKRA